MTNFLSFQFSHYILSYIVMLTRRRLFYGTMQSKVEDFQEQSSPSGAVHNGV